jgi:hypothetical protein
LRRVLKVFAGQTAKAQTRARRRLKQQRAYMLFLLALTPQFDRIVGLDLDSTERLTINGSPDRRLSFRGSRPSPRPIRAVFGCERPDCGRLTANCL